MCNSRGHKDILPPNSSLIYNIAELFLDVTEDSHEKADASAIHDFRILRGVSDTQRYEVPFRNSNIYLNIRVAA